MAYLNQEERDKLLNEIVNKNFAGIRFYVHQKDPKARLAYFRNVQESTKWMTRYVMPTLGVMVTVYENQEVENKGWFSKRNYVIDKIAVAPTADNTL